MAPSLVDRNAEFTRVMGGRGKKTGASATRTSRVVATAESSGAAVAASTRPRNRGSASNVPPSPASRTRLRLKQAKLASSQQPASKADGCNDLTVAMESAAPVARKGLTSSKTTAREAVRKGTSSTPLSTVAEEPVDEHATGQESRAASDDVGERTARD